MCPINMNKLVLKYFIDLKIMHMFSSFLPCRQNAIFLWTPQKMSIHLESYHRILERKLTKFY